VPPARFARVALVSEMAHAASLSGSSGQDEEAESAPRGRGLEVLGPPPQSVCREKAVQGFQSAPSGSALLAPG